MSKQDRTLPECWGHRGASATYPENTLASFQAAIRDGAEGIESDVHVSKDGVVVMFHDPDLSRTTDSTGRISEREWYGEKGMQHVRTKKQPGQAIPTFSETLDLLMRPENRHVKFDVDVKPQNDPDTLFTHMHHLISSQPNWQTELAPRIILGLWHPRFLEYAKARLPYCRRSYIGVSTEIARKYFWNDVDYFSLAFATLATKDGVRFRRDCQAAGKFLLVWTVNEPHQMMEAVRWGVDGIITDTTKKWLDLRKALRSDYDKVGSRYSRFFLWTSPFYYNPIMNTLGRSGQKQLESIAGPFDQVVNIASIATVGMVGDGTSTGVTVDGIIPGVGVQAEMAVTTMPIVKTAA